MQLAYLKKGTIRSSIEDEDSVEEDALGLDAKCGNNAAVFISQKANNQIDDKGCLVEEDKHK